MSVTYLNEMRYYNEKDSISFIIFICIFIGILNWKILLIFILIYLIFRYIKSTQEPKVENYIQSQWNKPKPNLEYTDKNGYLRNSYNDRLIHREIAYTYIYDIFEYPKKFSKYQVHHKDGNKQNNNIKNLQIVTKKEHEKIHGIIRKK